MEDKLKSESKKQNKYKDKKVIVIAGPTASGKTKISVELAKKLSAEIVSADSVQVYKGFDIGSAKVTDDEKQGIVHYMIDEVEKEEMYSLYDFKNKADSYITNILENGKIPIIAGGTGFYIQSLLKDIDMSEESENTKVLREKLYEEAKEYGNEYVHEKLKDIDYESYEKIHANNLKRVIRAIEFYNETGMKISEFNTEEKNKEYKYDVKFFVLYFNDRNLLYDRVNKRVDEMIENGLFEEVENLYKDTINKGYDINSLTSFKAIGYKEIIEFIEGKATEEEAIENIKKNTRHLVKKQYTWFTHQVKEAIWVPIDLYDYDVDKIVDFIIEKINT